MQNFNQVNDPNQNDSLKYWEEFEYREGFGIRFGMFLLDCVTYMLFFLLIAMPTGILSALMNIDWTALSNPSSSEFMMFMELSKKSTLISLVIFAVFILMDSFLAATPAKLMLSRRIASANRRPAERGVLIKRALIKWGFAIFTLISLLTSVDFINTIGSLYWFVIIFGGLAMLSQKRQALHDFLAKTAVYHVDDIIYHETGSEQFNNPNNQG